MFLLFFTLTAVVATGKTSLTDQSLRHLNNAQLQDFFVKVHRKCPNITRIYELNQRSVKGWPLVVMEISRNPGKHEECK